MKQNEEVKFYIMHDKDYRPRITVALKRNGGSIIRGIAICSKKDRFDPALGRVKAKGRAIKAEQRQYSDLPINRDEAIRILFESKSIPFHFKSTYNAALTDREQKLMGV